LGQVPSDPARHESALVITPIGTVVARLIDRRYKKVKKGADRFDELTRDRCVRPRASVKSGIWCGVPTTLK
jgi:hypothetical protein